MALNKPVLHKKTPQLVIAQIQIQIEKLFQSLVLILEFFLKEVKVMLLFMLKLFNA